MARKRTSYTDDFRASAVLMLEAAGYPDKKGALDRVSSHLGVPHNTLSGWANRKNNPPPSELRQIKKDDLISAIRDEIFAAIRQAENVRPDAAYRDLITGVGILTDKLQMLSGQPTENIQSRIIIEYDTDSPAATV